MLPIAIISVAIGNLYRCSHLDSAKLNAVSTITAFNKKYELPHEELKQKDSIIVTGAIK